ncbi:MAG: hypothetical protein CMN60_12015 [Sphingobium sp.]|jgi:hypothetical protein|nr:hypothetical protein [Sphingobium sp.]|tara:strand:+ start:1219 stop:2328 length:1110 start_codon:yes stop_codon:yes gene_type:complete
MKNMRTKESATTILGNASVAEKANMSIIRNPKKMGVTHRAKCLIPPCDALHNGKSISGGVYSNGNLCEESKLVRAWNNVAFDVTVELETIPKPTGHLKKGIYGGYLFSHYGHFMLETLSRLWWSLAEKREEPVIFQVVRGGNIPDFAKEILNLLNIDYRLVTNSECLEVEELFIPSASLVERLWVAPEFLVPFQTIADSFPDSNVDKLFVSRGERISQIYGERLIMEICQSEGFTVLDPTTSSLREQIVLFASAKEIIGGVGSALHNLPYCRNLQKVAYLARAQSIASTYKMIDDRLDAHDNFWIYASKSILPLMGNLTGPYMIDAHASLRYLQDAGFISKARTLSDYDVLVETERYMMEFRRLYDLRA